MLCLFLFLQLGFAEEISAKDLFYNAVSFVETEQYDLAIEAFKKAYELSNRSIILYNISQVYEKMEEYELAMEYLNQYRMYANEEERDSLSQDTLRLKKLIDEQKLKIAEEERKQQEELQRQKEEQARIEEQKRLEETEKLKKQQALEQAKIAELEKKNKRNAKIRLGTSIGIVATSAVAVTYMISLNNNRKLLNNYCDGICIDHGLEGKSFASIRTEMNDQQRIVISSLVTSTLLFPFPFIYKKIEKEGTES